VVFLLRVRICSSSSSLASGGWIYSCESKLSFGFLCDPFFVFVPFVETFVVFFFSFAMTSCVQLKIYQFSIRLITCATRFNSHSRPRDFNSESTPVKDS
jgi:hypothetical protein